MAINFFAGFYQKELYEEFIKILDKNFREKIEAVENETDSLLKKNYEIWIENEVIKGELLLQLITQENQINDNKRFVKNFEEYYADFKKYGFEDSGYAPKIYYNIDVGIYEEIFNFFDKSIKEFLDNLDSDYSEQDYFFALNKIYSEEWICIGEFFCYSEFEELVYKENSSTSEIIMSNF